MDSTSLRDFVDRARAARRIRFGDLRRLQRDILPARLTRREDAELLLSLDGAVERTDPDWNGYLVRTITDFVVWGLPPVGTVDRDKAEWFLHVLSSSSRKRALVREVVSEAREVDSLLLTLVSGGAKRSIGDDGRSGNQAAAQAGEPGEQDAALPETMAHDHTEQWTVMNYSAVVNQAAA